VATNYAAGAAVERKVVMWFRAAGWESRRCAGSHGPFDVVAVGPERIILIQCKMYTVKPGGYQEDVKALHALAVPDNVEKYLAVWQKGKGWDSWVDLKRGQTYPSPSSLTFLLMEGRKRG